MPICLEQGARGGRGGGEGRQGMGQVLKNLVGRTWVFTARVVGALKGCGQRRRLYSSQVLRGAL